MKQNLSPAVFITVIAVFLVIAAGALVWVFGKPSASVASGADAGKKFDPRNEQRGPSEDQVKQIQEWKKNHPEGFTKY